LSELDSITRIWPTARKLDHPKLLLPPMLRSYQDLAVRAAVDAGLAVEPIEAGAHEVVAGSTEHQVGVELPVHNVATTADEASGITLTG
jgi:hypothetical protein